MAFIRNKKTFKCVLILAFYIIPNFAMANSEVLFFSGFEKYRITLNDTGINWAADSPTGNNSTCTSNISALQDCNKGRDFNFPDNSDGHAGFSFVKLDSNGIPLADQSVLYIDTPWACVKDNVTGLIWETKTNDGLIHDNNITYKWGGITAIGRQHPNREGNYFDDWNSLIEDSNTNNLCGISAWRVPTITELSSITNKAASYPSIDTDFFPNNISGEYWSANPSTNGTDAWMIRFEFSVNSQNLRNSLLNLRLVNSEQ